MVDDSDDSASTFRASYATKSAAWTPSLATTAPAELIWTCVPLTPTQFQELSKKGRPFRCRRCVCDRSNGKFNYFRSLKRYGISFLCLKFVKTFNVSSLNIALGLQACQTTASAGFKFRQGSTAKGYKVGQSRVCGIGLRCHRQVIRVANRCSAERH